MGRRRAQLMHVPSGPLVVIALSQVTDPIPLSPFINHIRVCVCLKDVWPPVVTSCSGVAIFLFLLKFSFTDWRTNSQKVKVNRSWREKEIKREMGKHTDWVNTVNTKSKYWALWPSEKQTEMSLTSKATHPVVYSVVYMNRTFWGVFIKLIPNISFVGYILKSSHSWVGSNELPQYKAWWLFKTCFAHVWKGIESIIVEENTLLELHSLFKY